MLTQDLLLHLFDYDQQSGRLYYKSGIPAEQLSDRYPRVNINGSRYWSHRLIWCMVYGKFPTVIDHANGDCYDNRLTNLREATPSQNIANANYGPNRGIEKHGAKIRARIWVDKVRIELGSFETIEKAQEAYKIAAINYFGEFAFSERK